MKKLNLLLLLMTSCFLSFAATISGTITNGAGQPVPGLTVTIIDSTFTVPPTGYMDTTTTNANGVFSFTIPGNIPSGNWMEIYTNTCGMMYTQMYQYTGQNGVVNFTVCGGASNLYDTTQGWVFHLGPNPNAYTPAYPATVYLIEKTVDSVNNSFFLTLLDSTNTDTNGMYQFTYLAGSNNPYLVKAALTTSNPNYSGILPTYFDSSLTWDLATAVNGLSTVNVFMISGSNPGGPGFIGGSVLQGANKTTAVGDPLSKRVIFLTDMNGHPVGYTYSDATGSFGFSNLAYGSYKLFGDAPGKTHPILVVTISATQQSVNNVVFEENSTSFQGHIGPNNVNEISVKDVFRVYPNPVKDQINISQLDQVKGTKTIRLVSMNGTIIFNQATEKQTVTIPVQNFATGIYSLIINSEEGTATYTIVK